MIEQGARESKREGVGDGPRLDRCMPSRHGDGRPAVEAQSTVRFGEKGGSGIKGHDLGLRRSLKPERGVQGGAAQSAVEAVGVERHSCQ